MGAFIASLVLALQLPASNVGGYTKRTTATAIVFLAYCVGNIIGKPLLTVLLEALLSLILFAHQVRTPS
jgi:hypothetical protein